MLRYQKKMPENRQIETKLGESDGNGLALRGERSQAGSAGQRLHGLPHGHARNPPARRGVRQRIEARARVRRRHGAQCALVGRGDLCAPSWGGEICDLWEQCGGGVIRLV